MIHILHSHELTWMFYKIHLACLDLCNAGSSYASMDGKCVKRVDAGALFKPLRQRADSMQCEADVVL